MKRRALLAALAMAGCGGENKERVFTPPRFDYLTPLRLNVATVDIGDPPAPGPLDASNPAPPGPALRQMGQDRLAAGGSGGRAVFTITDARIVRGGSALNGTMGVRLDIFPAEGQRSASAEARVSRQTTGIDRDRLRPALYDMTRAMLDDMNVEFEFQLRRSLKDWLQDTAPAPPPPRVEQQDLPLPAATSVPPARP